MYRKRGAKRQLWFGQSVLDEKERLATRRMRQAEEQEDGELMPYAPEVLGRAGAAICSASNPRALYDHGLQVIIDLTAPVQDAHIRLTAAKVLLDEFREERPTATPVEIRRQVIQELRQQLEAQPSSTHFRQMAQSKAPDISDGAADATDADLAGGDNADLSCDVETEDFLELETTVEGAAVMPPSPSPSPHSPLRKQ